MTERTCRLEGNRLAYYVAGADAQYWDEHWNELAADARWARAERGWLPRSFGRALLRHLPPGGRVLEAGCGLGHVVLGLEARGFRAEGIDWAAATVERIKRARPAAPVRVGDVRKIDAPDGHYDAYVSLGVMEHFREGPEAIIAEARRVLRVGGVLLASVPHLNAVRRRVVRADAPVKGEFYQYAFTELEFTAALAAQGFAVEATHYYSATTTVRDHLPRLQALLARLPRLGQAVELASGALPAVGRRLGHMMLVAARRTG